MLSVIRKAKTEEDMNRATSMSASVGEAYQTLGNLSRYPLVRDAYEQRVKFLATIRSEVKTELKPIIEEQKRQIAEQDARIAELERMLNEKR
jgi:hypothetical protein